LDETALLDLPGTAVEEDAAPPSEETPESAAPLAPETDEQVETPENEAADPISSLSDEEIAGNERIKKLLDDSAKSAVARAEESARRTAETRANETRHEQEMQQHQQVAQGQALGLQVGVMRQLLDDPQWVPDQQAVQKLNQTFAPFVGAARVTAKTEVSNALNEALNDLNPSYRVPPERLDEWNRASVQASAAPMTKVAALILADAAREAIRAEVRAEVEAEFSKESKTEQGKAADTAKRGAPRPAGVAGASPTTVDHRATIGSPTATPAQKAAAFKALYGFDPD